MKNLQKPFSWVVFILFGIVTIFVLTGLPYDQFNWTTAMAEYGNPGPQPTSLPPVSQEQFTAGDPVQTFLPGENPVILLPGQTDPIPLGNVLFTPERKTVNVGVQSVIDRGVVTVIDYMLLIDGYSYDEPFGAQLQVCLYGAHGQIVFLAADQSPRVPVDLPSAPITYIQDGVQYPYTCAYIDRPGLVVLVEE
jgi:hypothetical protein